MFDVSVSRKRLKLHNITWEEKCWLFYDAQDGKCALCLQPIELNKAFIDHDHSCVMSGTHKRGAGCRDCIRGALCSICNSPVLLWMERFPHLQSEFVRDYLARRPFIFKNSA